MCENMKSLGENRECGGGECGKDNEEMEKPIIATGHRAQSR